MTELIELLHLEIDRLEAALSVERQRADGLARQLDAERMHVAELYERFTPSELVRTTTFRLPVFGGAEAWHAMTGE